MHVQVVAMLPFWSTWDYGYSSALCCAFVMKKKRYDEDDMCLG